VAPYPELAAVTKACVAVTLPSNGWGQGRAQALVRAGA
jgi:hypothetical protein